LAVCLAQLELAYSRLVYKLQSAQARAWRPSSSAVRGPTHRICMVTACRLPWGEASSAVSAGARIGASLAAALEGRCRLWPGASHAEAR